MTLSTSEQASATRRSRAAKELSSEVVPELLFARLGCIVVLSPSVDTLAVTVSLLILSLSCRLIALSDAKEVSACSEVKFGVVVVE